MRILIGYAGREGQSEKIAGHIAAQCRQSGHAPTVVDLTHQDAPRPDVFAGVILVGSVHVGQHEPALADFIKSHRQQLDSVTSIFFSVSLSAAEGPGHDEAGAKWQADRFLDSLLWRPDRTELVAGALRYSRYGFFTRLFMRNLLRKSGVETDGKHDIEYTDWPAVAQAVGRFIEDVGKKSAAE